MLLQCCNIISIIFSLLHVHVHACAFVVYNVMYMDSYTLSLRLVLFYSVLYEEFIREFKGSGLKFEQVPFNHPMFIMYSSGTTGTPKCMVHSVGVSNSIITMS